MKRLKLFTLLIASCTIMLWTMMAGSGYAKQDDILILVDTNELTLKVLQGDQEMLTFSNIAIGRYGTATDKRRGDNKTPLGHFSVAWITDDTQYHRFFGFSYPSIESAERAYVAGHLDDTSWDEIQLAYTSGGFPPQDTVLGGYLGIHGIGEGDVDVHKQYNWTNGCVALTNEQVDRLMAWVRVGTSIEIR